MSTPKKMSVRDRIAMMQRRGGGNAAATSADDDEGTAEPPPPPGAATFGDDPPTGRELKSGPIKRGGAGMLSAVFSSRHAVLYSDPVIWFWEDEARTRPKGTPFKLTAGAKVLPTAGTEGSIEACDEGCGKARVLRLKASTREDAQSWWTAIGLAVHAAFPPEDPTTLSGGDSSPHPTAATCGLDRLINDTEPAASSSPGRGAGNSTRMGQLVGGVELGGESERDEMNVKEALAQQVGVGAASPLHPAAGLAGLAGGSAGSGGSGAFGHIAPGGRDDERSDGSADEISASDDDDDDRSVASELTPSEPDSEEPEEVALKRQATMDSLMATEHLAAHLLSSAMEGVLREMAGSLIDDIGLIAPDKPIAPRRSPHVPPHVAPPALKRLLTPEQLEVYDEVNEHRRILAAAAAISGKMVEVHEEVVNSHAATKLQVRAGPPDCHRACPPDSM